MEGKVIPGFLTAGRVGDPNTCLVQGSTVIIQQFVLVSDKVNIDNHLGSSLFQSVMRF